MIATKVIKIFKTLKPNKNMCIGCRDNMYNTKKHGGCVSFNHAKVCILAAYSSPASNKRDCKQKTLTCYRSR